jgi:predicted tellurium resistance membrane protein TerC
MTIMLMDAVFAVLPMTDDADVVRFGAYSAIAPKMMLLFKAIRSSTQSYRRLQYMSWYLVPVA